MKANTGYKNGGNIRDTDTLCLNLFLQTKSTDFMYCIFLPKGTFLIL